MRVLRNFLFMLLALTLPAQAEDVVPRTKAEMNFSFAPVVKKASPAVVNIFTKSKVQVRESFSPFANDPFFQQFFGNNGFGGRTREQVVSSLGSGVIISADGTIVTSHHVIKDAEEIRVVLWNKKEVEAKVTLRDPQSDLAFLKITSPIEESLPHLELRDSDTLEVGDLVLAIGNPFGVGQTVTNGIISALARQAQGVSDYSFFIQTDAAINPGNSGGALVDMQGRLIGINTAIYSRTGASNGIGFAIPANMVKSLMNGKVEGGRVVKPWLGISVQPITPDIAESQKIPVSGVLIRAMAAGSPADKAGFKVGDILVGLNDSEITDAQTFRYRLALAKIGEKSDFKILRAGQPQTLSIMLSAPPETPARDQRTLKGNQPLSGIIVANLSPALAEEMDFDSDIGVAVIGGSSRLPLQKGDVLLEINGTKITSTKQLEGLLSAPGHSWKIAYRRGGNVLTLSVSM